MAYSQLRAPNRTTTVWTVRGSVKASLRRKWTANVPSPVLHSFTGFVLDRITCDAPSRHRLHTLVPIALILAANAPDLDFVAGMLVGEPTRFHRGASHSLLLAGLFGLAAFVLAHWSGWWSPRRFGLLMCLAFTSHIFLDMLSPLGDPERGVALAWPLIDERYSFPVRIFLGVRFDPRTDDFLKGLVFQRHNFYVVMSEVVLVSLIWGLAQLARSRSPRGA